MTIVILGVVAAVAVPKLVNLSKDARIAALQSLEGAIRSQVNLVQMKCVLTPAKPGSGSTPIGCDVNNTNAALASDLSYGNATVSMIYGIPRHPTVQLSIAGLLGVQGNGPNANAGTIPGFNVSISTDAYDAGGAVTFTKADAPDPTNCKIVYEPGKYSGLTSAALAAIPLDQRYTVTTTLTGC